MVAVIEGTVPNTHHRVPTPSKAVVRKDKDFKMDHLIK